MTMMIIETATAIRFAAGANLWSSGALPHRRPKWNLEDVNSVHVTSRRLLCSGIFDISRNNLRRTNNSSFVRRCSLLKNEIRASAEHLGSASGPGKQNRRPRYHPFEDIAPSTSKDNGDARLTPLETARTIIEVNSKATVIMLTSFFNDEYHGNIFWPDLPYVTDEYGSIYFQVNNDEDILQTLAAENNFLQVIVGFDSAEMISGMELLGHSEIDVEIEGMEDEDVTVEDSNDEEEDDEVDDEDSEAVLEDEDEDEVEDEDEDDDVDEDEDNDDDEEEDDYDETLEDWAKLETMRSSHPMYFAKKLAQVASDDPIDWKEQPPAGLAIQGIVRPAFIEEHSDIQRHMSGNQTRHDGINQVGKKIESKLEDGVTNDDKYKSGSPQDSSTRDEGSEKHEIPRNGATFYKLEMIKIYLISAYGHPTMVEIEDLKKAQPDAIAHSAAKIISRLKAGGEKITHALKSLCCRCKGIQVEEAALIGVDSRGFDLRVCSGTQIQTLRFAFNSRATSEYSAERQLNDLLFPRTNHTMPKTKQTRENEL